MATVDEGRVLAPELLQRVEDRHEPLCRGEGAVPIAPPLTEWAYATDVVLDALHQPTPALLSCREEHMARPADDEENSSGDNRSAICPLLT